MKFSVAAKDLAEALSRISSAIPQRSPMAVLENVLLQLEGTALTLTATDMDISVSTRDGGAGAAERVDAGPGAAIHRHGASAGARGRSTLRFRS